MSPEKLAPLDPLAWMAAADLAEEAQDSARAAHCRKVSALVGKAAAYDLFAFSTVGRDAFLIAGVRDDEAFHAVKVRPMAVPLAVSDPATGLRGFVVCNGGGMIAAASPAMSGRVRPGFGYVHGPARGFLTICAHPEDLPAFCA